MFKSFFNAMVFIGFVVFLGTGCSKLEKEDSNQAIDSVNGLLGDSWRDNDQDGSLGSVEPASLHEVTKNFPKGAASLVELCQNAGNDRFTQTFCGNNPPTITSLRDLHQALGVDNANNSACTTNSVSLVKTETSVLNPRCINFSANGDDVEATAVGYLRAELTFAEVVSRDPVSGELRFFLVDFDLPCELGQNNCTNADYYSESAESNWAQVSFYEDNKLENTILDCTMCHQPGGPNSQKLLRMAETDNSWTHWFRDNRDCGQELLADFQAAHAGETRYAGLTLNQVENSDPARLENFVEDNGFQGAQFGNNFFNSNQIINQLANNNGVSASWQNAYDARAAADNLTSFGGVSMPYRECHQSDPARLADYSEIMVGIRNGTVAAAMMPHLPEVNLDDEQALRDRSILPKANLSPEQILANACVSCHNSNLNQNISRAKFNAQDLTRNVSSEYDVAIDRLRRLKSDLKRMPPATHMNLTDNEINSLVQYFEQLKQ